jgi:hypothetical protein
MLAIAAASPVDQKTPLNPVTNLNINKPILPLVEETRKDPLPINKPLFKRDTPVDPKNNPQKNAQKNPQDPSPTATDVKLNSNKRPSRDTPSKPIDSYKPQPSGVSQKNAQAPSPASSSDASKAQSNIRPSRDTPKTPINNNNNNNNNKKVENAPPPAVDASKNTNLNTRPKRETPKTPVSNQEPPKQLNARTPSTQEAAKVTPNNRPSRDTQKTPVSKPAENTQKHTAPAPPGPPANTKTQQGSRVTRDAPKPAETNNQKPVSWNKDEKKVENKPQAEADRKTRETPKKEVKDDKAKATVPAAHPEVAKVPLTNSRNRRDAPNPQEQSKLVPSGSISGNPALKARDDSTTQAPKNAPTASNIKRDTEKQASGIHYPVPVSDVLKRKESSAKPAAATSSK